MLPQLALGPRQALVSSLVNRSAIVINPGLRGLRGSGDDWSRRVSTTVAGFPLQVDPEDVFVLPPAAVQEVHMKVQPWRAGSRFLYVNAVDVEHRRLISSWLICLNILQPVLSKLSLFFFLPGFIVEIHAVNRPWLFFFLFPRVSDTAVTGSSNLKAPADSKPPVTHVGSY